MNTNERDQLIECKNNAIMMWDNRINWLYDMIEYENIDVVYAKQQIITAHNEIQRLYNEIKGL